MSQIEIKEYPLAVMRMNLRAGAIASLLTIALWSGSALAEDEARSADVAAARELAIEGLKLADAGQCGQAIDKLSRAEKLHHAPIVLGRLGECEIAEGKIVDGTENLRKLLRETLPANPPAALLKARERAQAALDAAKPKIATLTITVREPTSDVTVTVDGQLVPPALYDRARPTDPGDHVVEVSAPGYLKSTRQVSLGAGEKEDLSFRLSRDPEAVAAAKEAKTAEEPRAHVPQQSDGQQATGNVALSTQGRDLPKESPNYVPSYVLWSVGSAAAAVGGVFGYMAMKDKSDLEKQCPSNVCPATVQSDLDSAKREALVSTILFGAGGAALAIGTVVYLVTGTSAEKPPEVARVTARPVIGLGHLGIQGSF